jgi:RNA polymerase sigma factor for flagellar operon FliA
MPKTRTSKTAARPRKKAPAAQSPEQTATMPTREATLPASPSALAPNVRDIWADYAATRTEKLRNQLMEHYLHLVKRLAQRIHTKLPKEVDLDDLISAGTFGLMYAVAAYDPGRAVKFETYCASRIRGAILDELRSWDWVPRLARLRAHKLVDATRQLQLELGREPSQEELATRLNVSEEELEKISRDGCVTRIMPLCRPSDSSGDESEREVPVLEDKRSAERMRGMEREDLKSLISRGLSRAEQLIIVLYYFEQMTMKEIGSTLDLSESRVSQMHSMILARLQAQLQGKRPELEQLAA